MPRPSGSSTPHSSSSARRFLPSVEELDEELEFDESDDAPPFRQRPETRSADNRSTPRRAAAPKPAPSYPLADFYENDDNFVFNEDVSLDERREAQTPFDALAARRESLAQREAQATTRLPQEMPPQERPLQTRLPLEKPSDLRPPTARPRAQTRSNATRSTATAKSNPKKRSSRSLVPHSSKNTPRALPFEIAGVLALTSGAVLLFYALRPTTDGFLPRIGVGALRFLFGIGAPAFAAVLCLLGLILIAYRQRTNFRAFGRGMTTAFLVFLTATHLNAARGAGFTSEVLNSEGGFIGGVLGFLLRRAMGEVGAVIALLAFALVALLLFTETTLADTATAVGRFVNKGKSRMSDKLPVGEWRERASEKVRDVFQGEDEEPYSTEAVEEKIAKWSRPHLRAEGRSTPGLPPSHITPFEPIEELLKNAAASLPEFHPHRHNTENPNASTPAENAEAARARASLDPHEENINPIEALEAQALATATGGEKTKTVRPPGERRSFGDGPLMPEYFDEALAALDPPIPVEMGVMDEDMTRGIAHVEDTLKAFRIDARVTDVKRGPVITRYEVQPAPGVRVSAIANLDRDLARSLSAYAVRIEAPVPGRNVVGIEVPNKKVHLVRMRDVLEVPEFLSAQSRLSFVLGKDIAGQPKWGDLTKMPHMLIAGATNSGKSVCLNSIIASILLRSSPEEVKFSLIDPKRVELTLFRDIPHLYHPVVVEPKDAVRALRGAIAEMDRRYKLFATRGVRNVASFNSKLEEGEDALPYLVIVIDELADLMMTAAAEFEKLICRIAQLARATGIHLIVATQRPSVNVITGVIKANIPARVAFAVASQVDSRTILDSVGAERLIGSGDMLFDANTGGKSVRIQGAYLSEEEVNRVVEVVKNRYADRMADYSYGLDLATVDTGDSKVGGDDDGEEVVNEKRDDLYDEIKAFIGRYEEMSASLIQRKFEIGYPRAGRIVDQLERDGVLGPADGPKARKVLSAGRD